MIYNSTYFYSTITAFSWKENSWSVKIGPNHSSLFQKEFDQGLFLEELHEIDGRKDDAEKTKWKWLKKYVKISDMVLIHLYCESKHEKELKLQRTSW